MHLRVTKSPSEALALTNCAFFNASDLPKTVQYIMINGKYRFNVRFDGTMESGHVGLSKVQRSWANLALNDEATIGMVDPAGQNVCVDTMAVQVDFMRKGVEHPAVYDSGKMAEAFHAQFDQHVFSHQQVYRG